MRGEVSEFSIDNFKRRVYTVIFAFAWCSGLFGFAWALFSSTLTLTLIVILGLNSLFHPIALLLVWRKDMPLRITDSVTMVFGAVIFAGTMMASFYLGEAGENISIETLYLWMPVIYVFAFASFKHKIALRLCLIMWGSLFVLSLPFLAQAFGTYKAFLTIQQLTLTAAFIAALFFFASFQHRLRMVQLGADEMAKLANTDELTQVANRRRISEQMNYELLRFSRYQHPFSIIMFDIDHFKKFNDSFGHDTGDEILRALVRRSEEVLREVDSLGRWGGEEFIIVLPETNYSEALLTAHQLCKHVVSKPLLNSHSISLSCGVTESRLNDSVESLFKRADAALYKAKRCGRNRAEGLLELNEAPLLVPN